MIKGLLKKDVKAIDNDFFFGNMTILQKYQNHVIMSTAHKIYIYFPVKY